MGHCFSHLTKTDRYRLEDALLDGKKPKEIAERLHVHVSTIYREIKRARMIHRNSDWTEEEPLLRLSSWRERRFQRPFV